MKCVVCENAVETLDIASPAKCAACSAPLCPGDYGIECRKSHNERVHPAQTKGMDMGAVTDFVKALKAQLREAEARATIAEGKAAHWKAVNNETEVNWKARFGALVKWMRAAHPDQLKEAVADGLAKESDILPEG